MATDPNDPDDSNPDDSNPDDSNPDDSNPNDSNPDDSRTNNDPKVADDVLRRLIKDPPEAWGFVDQKEKGDFLRRIYKSITDALEKEKE